MTTPGQNAYAFATAATVAAATGRDSGMVAEAVVAMSPQELAGALIAAVQLAAEACLAEITEYGTSAGLEYVRALQRKIS